MKPAFGTLAESFAGAPGVGEPAKDWYDKPMRWAQIGFAEDDPGNYDQQFWLDYFKRLHVEAVTLNAGGAVAYYPTQVPFHYRSKWLGNMDTFGDLMKGCRAMGIVVVARTDAHACHQDVYDAHPDWIMVDAKGNKLRHPSDKDFWLTCALGPYNFEFMTAVHQEITTKYMVDGIFTNRWAGSGMCYCENCQKNFRTFSGLDLPRTRDPQDPARKQYIIWHQQRLFELWRLWNETIQKVNPNASYIANAGGGALSELDMKTVGELAPTLFADRQGRAGLMPPWANGKNGKEYRSTMGRKAIVGIFSMGLEDKYRWKDSVQSDDEIRLWVADGIAHDLRPWFTKFDCKIIDPRWVPVIEGIYKWHAANEAYLRNERPLARVGLVFSQQTASYYGGEEARAKVEDPGLGFYQALIEARIPFEMVHDHLLDSTHVSQFRTLILPNIAALSTAQCKQLQEFVEGGGNLVATFETSLYDEWGVRRTNFGLASLFGVNYAGKVEGPMLNSYLSLNKDSSGQYHPLLKDLEDSVRIINGANQVSITPAGDGTYPLQVVPTYPDLPMEEVFPRKDAPKGEPGAVVRQVGKGRVVYLPGDIDRTFWETLSFDQARLLRNAVLWATNEPAPLTVEGKGVLDVSVWTQKSSMTAHFVNLTNPMMMKGPIREIIPITAQQVSIKIPDGRKVKQVHLLVAGIKPNYTNKEGILQLEVPSIALHEVVAVDFA
ncbi:beta-galactosidase trimerization domain-containing protein [Granulicella sp. WH15]|uniref:beta-galactosidase trimerization domain-containing protein n=1 Tax=Granulicella sp. WH15 TaxID=2602070 RepID=UPI001C700E57|nr:beta-galactosidase trimerization domain-containing protein [Granulicella sp. WH15]